MVPLSGSLLLLSSLAASIPGVYAKGWRSPEYPANALFSVPLPRPPIKAPRLTFTNPQTGQPIDYYEIVSKPFTRKQYPNKSAAARMVGYDGTFPGPQFNIQRGREAVVRYINQGDLPMSVHLHGSYSRAPFDGYADDQIKVGQYKDYYYPNSQNARFLWYHDHVVDHTAQNVYFGQAGFYIMSDPQEASLGLPSGNYDIPMVLMARQYNDDGTLWDPEKNQEVTSVYGDVVEVNGQPWPNFKVEPRKYRLRFLDGGISRTWKLFFNADQKSNAKVPFTVIGSDAGLIAKSTVQSELTMSIAERWEVVVDFSSYAGTNVTLKNNHEAISPDDQFEFTDRVMRFIVGTTVTSTANNGAVPSTLRPVEFPPQNKAVNTRHFKFDRGNGEWQINGIGWHDVGERILADPKRGSVEIWELENGGGGWSHPIHVHLVDFQIISRSNADRTVLPYESAAGKDVVWLAPGETAKVIARFSPWPGLYMFHCHNLIHEDHEMLAEFNVTQVEGLGLNETELFINPLDPKYAPKAFVQTAFDGRSGDFSNAAIQDKVNFFANTRAYANVGEIEAKLAAYWDSRTAKERRDGLSKESEGMPAEMRRRAALGYEFADARKMIRGIDASRS